MKYGYLAHHGVKGQKWGVRRYQYEDGSLTAEGKKRYGLEDTRYMGGTVRSSAKALGKHVKQLNKDRQNDLKEDKNFVKQMYTGKERREKLREVKEMYRRSTKSIDDALKMKYGEDAVKRYANNQYMKAAIPVASAIVVADMAPYIAAVISEKTK